MQTINKQELMIALDSERGGKVVEIFDSELGRNLLLGDPSTAVQMPCEDGAVFSISGWDEAVPSLEPEGDVPRLGWAWRSPAECIADGNSILTLWRMPGWKMERKIVSGIRSLTSDYVLTNTAKTPSPLLWAAHVLYPTVDLVEAVLPGGQPIPGPMCDIEKLQEHINRTNTFWNIRQFSDIGKSWKFFLRAQDEVRLKYLDTTLILRTNAPFWGIWLNRGGLCDTCCIGVEPTLSPTDHTSQADCTVQPGESVNVSWSLEPI